MWFRRHRRRQPPVLLPSLDRLAELVERVVALIDEVTLAPAPEQAIRSTVPEPAPAPAPEPEPAPTIPPQADLGHVLFVSASEGYRLLQSNGPPPDRGAAVELNGGVFLVLRVGPSPLPGDRRRCAFVEAQSRLRPDP